MMRRSLASILLAGLLVVTGQSAWPAEAQTGGCQLAPVFMMLRDMIGRDRVGECAAPVSRNDAGEWIQPTFAGVMTFRPNDLVTTFSDGQTTWLFGPRGLESRPSNSRLPWEQNGAAGSPPSTAGAPPNTNPANPAGPNTAPPNSYGPAGVNPAAGGAAVPPPAPSPIAPTALPIKLASDATATSRPFDLAGGDYHVTWAIERQRGNASCYVGGRLRRADTTAPGSLVLHTTLNTSNDNTSSGESRLFAVDPGRYVLDVTTTGCRWEITLHAPR